MRITRVLGRGIYGQLLTLIVVPFVVLALFLIGFAWVEAQTQSRIVATQSSSTALLAYAALLTTEIDAETGMRGYVITGDPKFKEPFERSSAALDAQLALIGRMSVPPGLDGRRNRLLARARSAFAIDRELTGLEDRGQPLVAISAFGRGKRAMDAFRAADAELEAATTALREVQMRKMLVSWRETRELLVIEVMLGFGTTLALYFTVARRVVRRLRNVGKDAVAISRGLAPGETQAGEDEISLLDRTLREMLTEIKQRDAMLARYEVLAGHGQDIIVFIDGSARIVEANVAALEAYGYSRQEMLGRTLDALYEREATDLAATLAHVRSQGLTLGEDVHVRKNGEAFPVEVSYDAAEVNGEPLIVLVARDIAERRRTQAALAGAYERAVESSRLKSQFVATMSHEIRTPMNAVIGMNELLLHTTLDIEQREFAETVRDSSLSLLHVIDDVLDFSKIEAGKLQIDSIDLDLPDTVESATALFAAGAAQKSLSLMTYVDPKLRQMVRGDQNRIRQVLVNLIGNALKFTSEGTVLVSAKPLLQAENGSVVEFSIKDTGIGFNAETAAAIFEPFRQADGSTTRKFGGTGLGLSISRQLVELMGGKLTVASAPDRGAEFTFTVRFERALTDYTDAPETLPGTRVLIVDDDRFAREILLGYVSGWDMQGRVADSAAMGLSMMRAAAKEGDPYDIAIVDYAMPDVTGFDFGISVKADPLLAQTPMIMVTSYDVRRRGEEAIAAGFARYLTKPIRRSALYECIASAVGGVLTRPAVAEAAEPITHIRSERILVAEDAPVNQRLALRQLELLGFKAQIASDGREVLTAVAESDYDLVLMDCQMPLVDGLMATKMIRKGELRTGRHLLIVAMTANARAEDREECLAAGMDDYLAKPIQLAQLRAVIERWIPAEVLAS